ncbi:Hypothetical predicted protein [Octopus vulgaris]|uniref:Uncharacterized protein n=1 Tax=Octopus vulgaris TaxID=6645 RepID=A0AA36BZ04_OCTVU|nr:Hypothetical predicted protein [Octopus vulgaris]
MRKCGPGLVWKQPLCQCVRPKLLQGERGGTGVRGRGQGDNGGNIRGCPDRPPILTSSANRSPSTSTFTPASTSITTVFFTSSSSSSSSVAVPASSTSVTRATGRRPATDCTGNLSTTTAAAATRNRSSSLPSSRSPPLNIGIPCWQYRPHNSSRFMFQQRSAKGTWIDRHCAPSTRWSQRLCTCFFSEQNDQSRRLESTCEHLLYLPFTTDLQDHSPQHLYIEQSHYRGIRLMNTTTNNNNNNHDHHHHGAVFDGKTYLRLPYFNTNSLGQNTNIKFRFKPSRQQFVRGSNGDGRDGSRSRADTGKVSLVSNGCGQKPSSLHIIYDRRQNEILLMLKSANGVPTWHRCLVVDKIRNHWIQVEIEICSSSFEIIVNDVTCRNGALPGSLAVQKCDLILGADLYTGTVTSEQQKTSPFTGILQNVNISRGCGCV